MLEIPTMNPGEEHLTDFLFSPRKLQQKMVSAVHLHLRALYQPAVMAKAIVAPFASITLLTAARALYRNVQSTLTMQNSLCRHSCH